MTPRVKTYKVYTELRRHTIKATSFLINDEGVLFLYNQTTREPRKPIAVFNNEAWTSIVLIDD